MLEANLWIGRHKRFIYQHINRTTFVCKCARLSFETRLPRSLSVFLLTPFIPLETYAVSIFQSAEMTRTIDLFYSFSKFPYSKTAVMMQSLYLWSRKKTSMIAVHVENDTNDLYIDKKSWSAKEKRNRFLFYVFSDCEAMLQTVRWQKKTALAFLNAKMVYCYDGLQTQIYLYAENIFFSFYAKSYLLPLQMGSCLASVCQVLYSNIIHVSLYVTLLFTIAIRTSLLSDWQLLLLPSNSIFKYEIRLRWSPNN